MLRVGTSGDYPPFSFTTPDGGLDGLDVALVRRFARHTGARLEIVPFRWPDLLSDLRAHRFDVAVGGVTVRPERALVGAYTRPLVRAGAVVLAPPEVSVDAAGLRLAVNAGGHLERLAHRLFPDARLVPATENGSLARLLVAGAADAVLTDEVEADLIAGEAPAVRRLGPFTRDPKAWLGRDPALVARLDAWLRAREEDGSLATLRSRWLGRSRADRRSAAASDLDALLALADLRLAFMPAVAAAKRVAGRPVDDPAQEARVIEAAHRRAGEEGLEPDTVEALFRALVAAAREVQRAFLARPWAVEPMDLDREARPALARVSDAIVARARDVAAAESPDGLAAERVAAGLDPSSAGPEARLAIARAIAGLRLARDARSEKTKVCKGRTSPLEAGRQRPAVADRDQKSQKNSGPSAVSLR